jgi:hypothetical protein
MPLEVFYSYSHEDEKLRDRLEKQLALLKRTGLIVSWHDRRIDAGQEWSKQIDAHVRSAHIILLLISADFIASDYCCAVEMQIALERHGKHEAVVIPVILRPVDWSTAPFARLQALPRDGKPITKWENEDEAFADVARGIRDVVSRFEGSAQDRSAVKELIDRFVPEPRVVDAAIPSHIVKEMGTRLLVLIRLANSSGLKGILLAEEDTEARPEDVRSRPFKVVFPLGPSGRPDPLKVTVKLTSPDFSPAEQAKNILVPPDSDSEVCPFMLTPRRTGRLTVLVELQWEDVVRGHRSLLTKCVAEATEVPAPAEMNLVQMHVSVRADPGGDLIAGAAPAQTQPAASGRSPGYPRQNEDADMFTRSTPQVARSSTDYPREYEDRAVEATPRVSASSARTSVPASISRTTSPLLKPIIVAIIGAVPVILIGYWQLHPQHPVPTSAVIAGRVIDATLGVGVSQAAISLAGRPETYLTDDNGNFRVRMVTQPPRDGVRVQVKKDGCTTLDQLVHPSAENLMLQLHCAPSAPDRNNSQ